MAEAFDKAWEVVKMPRTMEEVMHYEAGRCPSCEGTGKQVVQSSETNATTLPAVIGGTGDLNERIATARELSQTGQIDADLQISMIQCVACDGTGKPDDEVWGDEGIMEEEDDGMAY